MPRTADYTKDFLKDWEKLSRSGRYDMHRLKQAMLLLISNDMPLGAEWLDHFLKEIGKTSENVMLAGISYSSTN